MEVAAGSDEERGHAVREGSGARVRIRRQAGKVQGIPRRPLRVQAREVCVCLLLGHGFSTVLMMR